MKKIVKIGKYIFSITLVVFGLGIMLASPVRAEYCSNITRSVTGYNMFGSLVMKETLHASGYSTALSGDVTAKWLSTDRCYLPNDIQNEVTWTEAIYHGEYAWGSFKVVVGINSPWGVVTLSQKTYSMKILF